MNFSFVILTWNRSPMLSVCLEGLYNAIEKKSDSEIIIYDNNSPDDTKNIICEFIKKYEATINIKVFYGEENVGLKAYKKLFSTALGNYIVEVDDDILEFPYGIDTVFEKYFTNFKKYGYLALDVVQNENTTGAKPKVDNYKKVELNGLIIEQGPTGGWCTGFRKRDYNRIKFIFNAFDHYNFKHGEDGFLSKLFKLINRKSGIISGVKCFHATGPYYSKAYGLLERDIEKYERSGRDDLVKWYSSFR